MTWIETLKLSSAGNSQDILDEGFLTRLQSTLATLDPLEGKIYRNSSVPGDLMIILSWRGERPGPLGSDLALSLSRELKKYGLVDHAVWVEDGLETGEIIKQPKQQSPDHPVC